MTMFALTVAPEVLKQDMTTPALLAPPYVPPLPYAG